MTYCNIDILCTLYNGSLGLCQCLVTDELTDDRLDTLLTSLVRIHNDLQKRDAQ